MSDLVVVIPPDQVSIVLSIDAAVSDYQAFLYSQAAAASATEAANSEVDMATQVAAAAASAVAAAGSATASATSSTESATSATASAGSASASAISAADSDASALAAATDAASINASLASFSKAWLGPHATDPVVDNQGNALVIGAAYENTSTTPPKIRIYTSTGWVDQDEAGEEASANAALAATQAAASAAAALASQNAAAASATLAQDWAVQMGTMVGGVDYSAKYYAGQSSTQAAAALVSANNAAASALAFNGELTLDVSAADVTLSTAQFGNAIFKFTGILTGNRIVSVPATTHTFIAYNFTSGKYSLTIIATGKSPSAQVVQGKSASLWSDANGVYATSSVTGVQFAGHVLLPAADAVLDITNLGTLVHAVSPGHQIMLPAAATYQAGAGIGFKNAAGGTATFVAATGSGDTLDLGFPLVTQNGDEFYFESNGVNAWEIVWYTNKLSPSYVTSMSAPIVLAGGATTNGVDVIQSTGSIGATGAGGVLRLIGAAGAAAQLVSTALGLDLRANGANPLNFWTNGVLRGLINSAGRLLFGTGAVDDTTSLVQVNGVVFSQTGGFKFPDGTVQVTANGITAPTPVLISVARGNILEGANKIVTTGYTAPFVALNNAGLRYVIGTDFTTDADNITLHLAANVRLSDEFELLLGTIYNPSTVFAPGDDVVTPAAGTTFIPYAHTPKFAFLFSAAGTKLVGGIDYTEDATGFYLTLAADGTESFNIYKLTPMTMATVAARGANSDITSLSGLTTPLSKAQGGTGTALGPQSVLLASFTITAGQPNVQFDLTGPFDDYEIHYSALRGSAGSDQTLYFGVSLDNGATWGPATAYSSHYNYTIGSSPVTDGDAANITVGAILSASVPGNTGNLTTSTSGIFELKNTKSTTLIKTFLFRFLQISSAGASASGQGGGMYFGSTAPLTNALLSLSAGNLTGRFSIYGINR